VGEKAGEGGDGQPEGRRAGTARPRQDHGAKGKQHNYLTTTKSAVMPIQ